MLAIEHHAPTENAIADRSVDVAGSATSAALKTIAYWTSWSPDDIEVTTEEVPVAVIKMAPFFAVTVQVLLRSTRNR
jgi:hypothetical protein